MTPSRATLFDTLFMIRLLSWLVTTLTCSWSRSDSGAHAAGANGRLFRARTRRHSDLACHGACLFQHGRRLARATAVPLLGLLAWREKGSARRSVCRDIGVRVEPSAGRRGRGPAGRPLVPPLFFFFGATFAGNPSRAPPLLFSGRPPPPTARHARR